MRRRIGIVPAFRLLGGNELPKCLSAPARPIELRLATIGKLSESSVEKMLSCQLGDLSVIGFDPGDSFDFPSGADVDDRQACPPDSAGDRIILDAGDEPITSPTTQPLRGQSSPLLLRKIDAPSVSLSLEFNDSPEQSSRVGVGGFDQKCYSRSSGHAHTRSAFAAGRLVRARQAAAIAFRVLGRFGLALLVVIRR